MASLPTLEEIKTALGIDPSDTSKDAQIERTLAAVIDIIETYCGRGFKRQAEVEEFDPISSRDPVLMLFRFPVESVARVGDGTQDFDANAYSVYKRSGMLRWANRYFPHYPLCTDLRDRTITVEYTGGYADDEWPASVVEAVEGYFYWKWNQQGAGTPANAAPAGAVKSASVDGLSITFGDALGINVSALNGAVIPAGLESWAAQLDPYRARRAVGA